MPNYNGHLIGGIISFCIIYLLPSCNNHFFPILSSQTIINFFLCQLGALAPDIDIQSKGRHIFDRLIFLGIILASFQRTFRVYSIFIGIFVFMRIVGHRKMTHNPIFVVIAPYCLAGILSKSFHFFPTLKFGSYLAFVGGALSHLILDAIPKRFLPDFFFK